MIRTVVTYPHFALRAAGKDPAELFHRNDERASFQQLIIDLRESLIASKDGVALAANQINVPWHALVISREYAPLKVIVGKYGDVFFNAKYEPLSQEKDIENEGCLSFPGKIFPIERWKTIKISARDLIFGNIEFTLEDFPARVFQHEIDHLEGRTFIDHLSVKERLKIAKSLRK